MAELHQDIPASAKGTTTQHWHPCNQVFFTDGIIRGAYPNNHGLTVDILAKQWDAEEDIFEWKIFRGCRWGGKQWQGLGDGWYPVAHSQTHEAKDLAKVCGFEK